MITQGIIQEKVKAIRDIVVWSDTEDIDQSVQEFHELVEWMELRLLRYEKLCQRIKETLSWNEIQ